MSRMEEALRRAQQGPALPGTPAPPTGEALEHFASASTQDTPPEVTAEASSAGEVDVAFEPAAPGNYHGRRDASVPVRQYALRGDGLPLASSKLSPALIGKLVIGDEVKPITIEQYRRLAAALHHAQADTGIKIVMVASALAGEGKTLTAINLALTLSESYGRKVLLIDADLRRPTIHQAFQLPNVSGLSDGLKAASDRKLTVAEITPRLSVLPAGRPDSDPMSGLTSGRMSRVLEEASAKFDWVILDTPPVGLITDAHLLAAMTDVAVLVVRAGRTPCALVQRAVESLDRSRVIGVVLNCVTDDAMSPAGKYGQYYSSYYIRPTPIDGQVGS